MSKSTPPRRDHSKDLVVSYVHHGRPEEVTVDVPDTGDPVEQRQEASHFVQTLADSGQLDGPAATHEIVAAPDGTRRLRRLGFSSQSQKR